MIAIAVGFGVTLFRNWNLFQPVRLTLAWDTFEGEVTDEALLAARSKVFELPLKRALWMLIRFITTGVIGLIFLNYYLEVSLHVQILTILITVVAGAASSICAYNSKSTFPE